MTHSAKRALPTMAFSLLMSASLVGPTMAAAIDDSASSHDNGHAAPSPKRIAPAAPHTVLHALAVKPATPAKAAPSLTAPRPDAVSTNAHRSGIIRRTSASLHADRKLIDDGTMWRESGSMATWQQTGMASWYGGKRWQGHRTASGAIYDQNQLTAAHATLPIGTKVRVMSHDGKRSVIVTINDRPGTRTRIIDLSREAAKELGILEAGLVMVTLQPL